MMNLTLILLKSGTTLVSQTEELEYEPKAHLYQPYEVSGKAKVTLSPWPCHTDDEHILLNSNDILTVCEPKQNILDSYLKKIGKTIEDFSPEEPKEPIPELLTEDENDILSPIGEDDFAEYEPNYIEDDMD